MSVVFETRNFIHDGNYPPMDEHHHDPNPDPDRFSDPTDAVVNELATVATFNAPPPNFVDTSEPRLDLGAPPLSKEDSPTATTPQRIKAIPKPDREVTKNIDGKYVCTWPGCSEDMKEFGRKCEWNKHMDKHDRPYKCAAIGCEKLPGFTYSGGLLRHEREVHGKHGGPKNSFNCPHVNCKRHTNKGFSRLENLNEHLRRVHTQNGAPNGTEGETDDAASDAAAGPKRKREPEEGADLREEIKRVRLENEELRRQVDAQNRQTVSMMHKIAQLQEALQPRLAPQAPMAAATMI
ncbi:hypothetical protein B0T26DRAFT_640177 [Lasiosphaeria miniovina]|uniref:C2H2-type domain-containing protein n=1 Tax=Lasiosphaeria miniovina TaxID=1954250 RepID=A0AA40E932_9PEZI|nr:uncharacterized protein B0T26DRAFT_640177 [Lasiosphaeria miniovina]KAK0728586.1 hypothetical protein B0T26DRAFT_640177 [Lasiosphaeria miniovina]